MINESNKQSLPVNMCKRTISGAEFMGAAEHAKSGLPCNYWESHPGASFPYGDSESNANFCRLATNDEGLQVVSEPWCYTERGPESCAIPYCSKYRHFKTKIKCILMFLTFGIVKHILLIIKRRVKCGVKLLFHAVFKFNLYQ